MIVVTGAAGFIASVVVETLNENGNDDLILVDDFSKEAKQRNFKQKKYHELIDRNVFIDWFANNASDIDAVIHLGARTDTTEFDYQVFQKLNVDYTLSIWNLCTQHNIPLIYASSAATYGDGEFGYDDSHEIVGSLKPLNAYGRSKNEIDKWILAQTKTPSFWAGLKFFNVYGPNEYHKGRMASVVLHSFEQIQKTGQVKLFRSHRPDFEDGMQLRDFVYVKDVAQVIVWLLKHQPENGLYNVGTGQARPFLALATSTFRALNLEPNIVFVDTPLDIREKYQYFTEAKMSKLHRAGYQKPFTSLESGVDDYVRNYLRLNQYY